MKIVTDIQTGKQYQARTPQQHPLMSDIAMYKGQRVFKLNISTQQKFIELLRERNLFNMKDILKEIDNISQELKAEANQLLVFLNHYLTLYKLETGEAKKGNNPKNTGKKKKVRCVCIDNNEVLVFDSAKQTALFLGYSPTTISNGIYSNSLITQKKTNLRFYCEYIEEE